MSEGGSADTAKQGTSSELEEMGGKKVAPARTAWEDQEEDNPLRKRSCTDLLCLLIFLGAIGGMGFIVYLSWATGDPFRLLYGTDSWGNTCGRKNEQLGLKGISEPGNSGKDLTQYKNVFFYKQLAMSGDVRVCVKQCMTQDTAIRNATQLQDYFDVTGASFCWYNIDRDSFHDGSGSKDTCPSLPIEKQISILHRCMPLAAAETLGGAAGQAVDSVLEEVGFLAAKCDNKGDIITNMLNDVNNTWMEILYMLGASVAISFIIVLLMRFFAFILIWTMFFLITFGSMGGAGYLWYVWFGDKDKLDSLEDTEENSAARKIIQDRMKNMQIYAITATVVASIILLIMCVMRKRIALVVQLFVEAGKAIARMPLLLIQPIWTLVSLMLISGIILLFYTWIETAGDPTVNGDGFVDYKRTDLIYWLRWVYVFGILWVVQFVFACHQMVIAGSVGHWYFTRDKNNLGWPIAASIRRLIRYHLGSVAFGAFIIAVVQFARLVLMYISKKLGGRAGPVAKFILKALMCCLWCLEKVLKFINWNAYIMIAIYGYSFCRAARRAFMVIVGNALRVAAINSVGTFTLFIGKLSCIALTVAAAYFVIKDKPDLCYVWTPLLVIAVGSFIVAHTFLGIYGMAIDTIFLCFCEDSEQNDGVNKPYYMSKGLMTFVSNASEAMKAQKHREKNKDENNNNNTRRLHLRDPQPGNWAVAWQQGETLM